MRMPFSHEEPQSRLERVRCAVRDRASGAAHSVSGAVGTAQHTAMRAQHTAMRAQSRAMKAQSTAMSAASTAQDTAQQVADRAAVVAHQVADRASVAAAVMAERARPVAERARPLATEAASRGGAAWQVLRHGAPQPSPMARMAGVMPAAAVTAARRSRAPLALMALGAAGAVGLLWWRRSRAEVDSVWILDSDSDVEPVGRWQEDENRAAADDTATGSGRRESPANRWP